MAIPRQRLVSVVLAVHNGEKFLSEQFESILAQTHRDLEVLVLDDASTDGSSAIVRAFQQRDSRVRAVRNDRNLGLVANFLKGVSLAQGDYVCYSDQDDIWRPEKIATLVHLLEETPRSMLAYSDLEVCDENMRRTHASFWKSGRTRPFRGALGERAFLKNIAPGCSMIFRGEVKHLISKLVSDEDFLRINRAEVLDEIPVMHDHLAWILAAGLGEVVHTPETLVRYRQHAKNNIGAFYGARRGSEGFIRCLESRMRALELVQKDLPGMDWPALHRFLETYRKTPRPPMPEYLKYFLWLRNDALRERFLGLLDCLAPSFYRRLRKMRT